MPLDPQCQALLTALESMQVYFHSGGSIERADECMDEMAGALRKALS